MLLAWPGARGRDAMVHRSDRLLRLPVGDWRAVTTAPSFSSPLNPERRSGFTKAEALTGARRQAPAPLRCPVKSAQPHSIIRDSPGFLARKRTRRSRKASGCEACRRLHRGSVDHVCALARVEGWDEATAVVKVRPSYWRRRFQGIRLKSHLPQVLSLHAVAKLLRCAETTVEECARRGELPGLKFGQGWVFPTGALTLRLNELAQEQAAERRKMVRPLGVLMAPNTAGRKTRLPPQLPSLDAVAPRVRQRAEPASG